MIVASIKLRTSGDKKTSLTISLDCNGGQFWLIKNFDAIINTNTDTDTDTDTNTDTNTDTDTDADTNNLNRRCLVKISAGK